MIDQIIAKLVTAINGAGATDMPVETLDGTLKLNK